MREHAQATNSTYRSARSGIYLVKTHLWYIERLVWIIAGLFLLIASGLTLLYGEKWSILLLCVGLSSIMVSLSGFCLVGNILYRFGVMPLLEDTIRQGNKKMKFYRMQTDCWYLERFIYLIVGMNLSVAALLAVYHSPYWLWFHAFVGAASVVFSFTGFCILANILYRLGAEPRLCRFL